MNSQIVVRAVRQIVDGVVSEEPDVVHSAKMRKDHVIHLLVVTLTADDVSCFLSVPLLRGAVER